MAFTNIFTLSSEARRKQPPIEIHYGELDLDRAYTRERIIDEVCKSRALILQELELSKEFEVFLDRELEKTLDHRVSVPERLEKMFSRRGYLTTTEYDLLVKWFVDNPPGDSTTESWSYTTTDDDPDNNDSGEDLDDPDPSSDYEFDTYYKNVLKQELDMDEVLFIEGYDSSEHDMKEESSKESQAISQPDDQDWNFLE